MSARRTGRRREVARLLDRAAAWAEERADVRAVVLVGSHARERARSGTARERARSGTARERARSGTARERARSDTPRLGSDVDLVVLVDEPARFDADAAAAALLGRVRPIRRRRWGPVIECRFRTPSGLHVELGVTDPGWTAVPLDPGTRRVLGDGACPVHDDGRLARALAAARSGGP